MSKPNESFGCVFAIAFILFGIFQVYAAFLGITDWVGSGWAIAAIALAFFLRTGLPILVGSFLCALNVWEWHWVFAILFAAPMLALTLPAMALSIVSSVAGRR